MNKKLILLLMIFSFVSVACTATDENGSLNLAITDGPVDEADAVWVQFSGIEIKSAKNEDISVTFDTPKRINLLDLQGSDSASLLDGQSMAAGDYQSIELVVDLGAGETVIIIAGNEHDLTIPSGSQSGLKMVRPFTVPAGGSADFTIDFDLRKSVVENNQGYALKPTLRLIDNVEVGHIKGNIDLATLGCDADGNAVYVYSGFDATPNDINVGSDNVLTTALVKHDEEENVYHYEAGFLSAGEYTVAVSCNADIDNPEQDDAVTFLAQANVTVEANVKATQDF